MIHWGILGAGGVARRFASSLQSAEDCELSAISARNPDKARDFCKEFSVPNFYTNHQELLKDPRIDAIYLALPHGMHLEWTLKAIRSGKAVLCEKPLGLTREEAAQMTEEARQRGVLFMEAMKPRFVPLYEEIRALVRAGAIGRITRVEASLCNEMPFSPSHPTYHTMPGQGGALLDVGIYCASWIQAFLPPNPSVLSAAASLRDGIDYYVDAELVYPDGRSARLECAFDRAKPRRAVLVGERGRIEVEDLHRPQTAAVYVPGQEPRTLTRPYLADDFYGEIRHFADCLLSGKTVSEVMSPEDSCACAAILDSIREFFPCRRPVLPGIAV